MKRKPESIRNNLLPVGTFCLTILIWWGISASGLVPSYMLPSPAAVVKAFFNDFPNLMRHAFVSVQEAIYGLAIGVVFAFFVASLMDRFETVEKALQPLLVVTQTIPTIAIAPLLVLWMGFGMAPKITLVIVTTFFPIAVGLLDGYKSVDPDEIALMYTMRATRLQIFRHVKIPSALPYFFSGLKVSASYAVVGAVISEWLGGFEGLGVYMTRVRKAYAFDKMFAVIILIIIVSLLLMALVDLIKMLSMPWVRVSRQHYQNSELKSGEKS